MPNNIIYADIYYMYFIHSFCANAGVKQSFFTWNVNDFHANLFPFSLCHNSKGLEFYSNEQGLTGMLSFV